MQMLMSEEAPMVIRVLVEIVFWLTFPVSLPVVVWIAVRQADAEVRRDMADSNNQGRRKSDRSFTQGEAW